VAPAVALFVQRAQAYRPAFTVDTANAEAVASICRRLDGLPLALELASARLKLFSPQALLARLGDRLALLTGGPQDAPQRHQALRATLAWSYDLLPQAEQVLFRRLGAFAGGCTLEAAEAVCADPDGATSLGGVSILDGVTDLVDQHLLRAEEGPEGEPRFAMLETIHAYSREQLATSAEGEALARHHAAYFVDLAERAEPDLRGPEQQSWLGRLDREHDNLRAVLEWSEKAGEAAGVQLAGALWRFWSMRGYLSEGRRWLEAAVGDDTAPAALRARALYGAGTLARVQGDIARAQAALEECLALRRALGDQSGIASALNNLGNVAQIQRDFTRARLLYEESLALQRALGDQRGIEDALENLGNNYGLQGDFARARAMIEESLSMARASGDRNDVLFSLHNLGLLTSDQGDFPRAEVLLDEGLHLARSLGVPVALLGMLNTRGTLALRQGDHRRAEGWLAEGLTLSREVGDRRSIVSALNGLANVTLALGDTQRAASLLAEGLTLSRELGDQKGIVDALEGIARLANARGTAVVGARLLGAAEAVRAAAELALVPGESAPYAQLLDALHAALDAEAFAMAWAEGRALSIEDSVTLALASS
jgi:tetratricopeptide (TPR) repeat protein